MKSPLYFQFGLDLEGNSGPRTHSGLQELLMLPACPPSPCTVSAESQVLRSALKLHLWLLRSKRESLFGAFASSRDPPRSTEVHRDPPVHISFQEIAMKENRTARPSERVLLSSGTPLPGVRPCRVFALRVGLVMLSFSLLSTPCQESQRLEASFNVLQQCPQRDILPLV